MLVVFINVVKVESVPLNFNFFPDCHLEPYGPFFIVFIAEAADRSCNGPQKRSVHSLANPSYATGNGGTPGAGSSGGAT